MEEINERIALLMEQKRLKTPAFSVEIGINYQTLVSQLNNRRSLSLETIVNILSTYKDLSAEWLLRGEGEMWIGKGEMASRRCPMCAEKERVIGLQHEMIDLLRERLSENNS